MEQIYWMGGSPCAGKTTISEIIEQEFGWQIYHIDRYIERYLQRATPDKQPHLHQYQQLGLNKFLHQPAQEQLQIILGMSHEQLHFILEDLAEIESDSPILVEGANLLAADVVQHGASAQNSIWMVPTEAFQLETYPKRGSWVQGVLKLYDDPEEAMLAFERWMERDALMARWTANQAKQQGIPLIMVDGSVSLLDNAEIIMRHFGLLDA